jgi:hypothetical protein
MTYRIRLIGALTFAALYVAPATAAELPARSAAGVEPMRACASQGAGFFSVPGSETCVRVSGRVRAEYQHVQARTRFENAGGPQTGARVQLDARTPTPYGPLRTVIRYDTRSMRN